MLPFCPFAAVAVSALAALMTVMGTLCGSRPASQAETARAEDAGPAQSLCQQDQRRSPK